MISKGRRLEKLSPALYAPECVEGGSLLKNSRGVLCISEAMVPQEMANHHGVGGRGDAVVSREVVAPLIQAA
jgi:hypothetical protein